ncbi:Ribosome modulation factor [Vibrio stylophorae]|uniref:Ribosome modulation factor n=1 Tax=Vibrio stylophorae TaxID=659351 RepID=A0ABN8DT22_9VIBR|nr:ribosome modulation factor [Vibrio stylophorae]CAH0533478.1 Ribosome modulation factor [Vibrio stylophorae]
MKRQKRDRLERAHNKGYNAGLHGRSSEDCPYQATDAKTYWLGGWREARSDKLSGLYK